MDGDPCICGAATWHKECYAQAEAKRAHMNICEALRMLELNGGYIYRDVPDEVGIEWDGVETWQNFEKDHASLLIGDLTATDWQHELPSSG